MKNRLLNITQDYSHFYFYILGIRIGINKKGYGKFIMPTVIDGHPILKQTEASECIYELIKEDKPCMVTRFGATEMVTLDFYEKHKDKNNQCKFPEYMKNNMQNQAGFFTPTDELLSKYCFETINIIKNIDVLGAFNCYFKNNPSEEYFVKNYAKTDIKIIESYMQIQGALKLDNPWTRILEGKRVLVIHPFETSIKNQYTKREHLFKNPLILPKFELETIKAVQGIDTETARKNFKDWFEALEYMYKEIDKKDFDIALIGAGCFGMLLANYIKQKGKKAIHLCGASQLLFGIKGQRWNNSNLYNEFWINPLQEEKPPDLSKFIKGEGECAYW